MARERRPWVDVDLHTFLRGVFAVWAVRARAAVDLEPGVFDAALHRTLPLLEPSSRRNKVRVRFRVPATSLSKRSSRLAAALRSLEDEGAFERDAAGGGPARILWGRLEADLALDEIPVPVAFLDRASNLLLKQIAAARVAQLRRFMPSLAGRYPAPGAQKGNKRD